MTTAMELSRKGFDVLVEKLGYTDAVRFIQLFDQGSGDYTQDRHQWLDQMSMDEILADIETRTTIGFIIIFVSFGMIALNMISTIYELYEFIHSLCEKRRNRKRAVIIAIKPEVGTQATSPTKLQTTTVALEQRSGVPAQRRRQYRRSSIAACD